MSVAAEQGKDSRSSDPREALSKEIAGGDHDLEMVAAVAQGAKLDEGEEVDALNFLLGARRAARHEIEVLYETDEGLAPMWFIVRAVDTRKIDKIESRNVDETNGTIDRLTADCQIVAEAAEGIRSASGRVVKLNSEEFLRIPRPDDPEFKHASPALALEERFRDQLGLISGVVLEIKRASGFSPDRVKKARRMLTSAALG